MNTSKRSAMALPVCLACVAFAQEKTLKRAEVPSPFHATLSKLYSSGTVSHWSMETEEAKTNYELSVTDASGKRDVDLAQAGHHEITVSSQGQILKEE